MLATGPNRAVKRALKHSSVLVRLRRNGFARWLVFFTVEVSPFWADREPQQHRLDIRMIVTRGANSNQVGSVISLVHRLVFDVMNVHSPV